MKQKALLLVGALSLESLLGCGSTKFPQYSGKYKLQEASYTDPAFAGEKKLPWDLTVIHRMKYVPNDWDDRLLFKFTPQNQETEIGGAVLFDLELLTADAESSFPHEYFKGEEIHAERRYYGGAFCNYQYQYHAFAILTPDEEQLKKVYPNQGEYLYTEPSGMPIYETFNPDGFEPSEETIDAWYEKVEKNGDHISLDFVVSRNIHDTVFGCDSESYLPPDPRGRESLKALYHSIELHDEEDPRLGFDDLPTNTIPAIDLFKEVISGVKDL
ncbi:MAG: hypothetical protein Q7S55_02145 [Nanoarchaeota archaeon]|nr:hypothetical protein [Nanoarchaeota archaeon]